LTALFCPDALNKDGHFVFMHLVFCHWAGISTMPIETGPSLGRC